MKKWAVLTSKIDKLFIVIGISMKEELSKNCILIMLIIDGK